jgi:GDPmannose 4,6-dehydratase
MKRALITGIRGQAAFYLAAELRAHGRLVFGSTHASSEVERLPHGVEVRRVDCRDEGALWAYLDEVRPDEIYHLASPSCVQDTWAFEREIYALSVNVPLSFLRWITDRAPACRFFFAGSSEIFGDPVASPQAEDTPARPTHPYGLAKLAGMQLCAYFRSTKGVFASTGILFNHESPLRRTDFVSRRVTRAAAEIALGRRSRIALGNLEALRDWSHAQDFSRGFRLALEASQPSDVVLASGEVRSVRELCQVAFSAVGLDYTQHVVPDSGLYRPDFTHPRRGDITRARTLLGWRPVIGFAQMIEEMVHADLAEVSAAVGR